MQLKARLLLAAVAVTASAGLALGTAAPLAAASAPHVVDGSGAGSPSNQQNEAIKRAQAKGVIVVATTRTGTGRVLETNSRKKSGVIPGDNLSAQKARILLQLALTRTSDPKEIKRIFDEY